MEKNNGNSEIFLFSIEGLDEKLRVLSFHGDEYVSQLYNFHLHILCENQSVLLDEYTGKAATFSILSSANLDVRHVNGVINSVSYCGIEGRFSMYKVELVPALFLLTHSMNYRVFENKTVPEIVQNVLNTLAGYSIKTEYLIHTKPYKRSYCVQYGESDLNFISRLLQEEGYSYYFRHDKDNHQFVITDHVQAHNVIIGSNSVNFDFDQSFTMTREVINKLVQRKKIQTGAVVLEDYAFKTPALKLTTQQSASENAELSMPDLTMPDLTMPDLTMHRYPGNFDTEQRGNKLAAIWLEQLRSQACTVEGAGNSNRMAAGHRFTMHGHNRESLNSEYLITAISHHGEQTSVREEQAANSESKYTNSFICVFADSAFRPSRLIKQPVISGVQTAVVLGPEDEKIFTDELGRVKVRFHWSGNASEGENTSCWLRVAQVWAGTAYGAQFLPRTGQEVIVSFIDGNPDRPVVTGCVYHGTNNPPYALPDNKTISGFKSASVPDDSGANELYFDDLSGQEVFAIHAKKNLEVNVGSEKTESVQLNSYEKVALEKNVQVGGEFSLDVGVNLTESVVGKRNEKICGNKKVEIGGRYDVVINNDEKTINRKMKYNYVKSKLISIADGDVLIESKKKIEFKVGANTVSIDKEGIRIKGKQINIKGSTVDIKADALLTINGSLVKIN